MDLSTDGMGTDQAVWLIYACLVSACFGLFPLIEYYSFYQSYTIHTVSLTGPSSSSSSHGIAPPCPFLRRTEKSPPESTTVPFLRRRTHADAHPASRRLRLGHALSPRMSNAICEERNPRSDRRAIMSFVLGYSLPSGMCVHQARILGGEQNGCFLLDRSNDTAGALIFFSRKRESFKCAILTTI